MTRFSGGLKGRGISKTIRRGNEVRRTFETVAIAEFLNSSRKLALSQWDACGRLRPSPTVVVATPPRVRADARAQLTPDI